MFLHSSESPFPVHFDPYLGQGRRLTSMELSTMPGSSSVPESLTEGVSLAKPFESLMLNRGHLYK